MPTLTPEQILAAPPAEPVPKKDLSPEQRILTRAVAHCAEGKLSRAYNLLLSTYLSLIYISSPNVGPYPQNKASQTQ